MSFESLAADLAKTQAETETRLAALQVILDDDMTKIAALEDEVARLKDAAGQAPPPPPDPDVSAGVALGFGGLQHPKAHSLRVFLNPGDAFPKPVDGLTHLVTYKGAADHEKRAAEAKAYGRRVYLGFHHEPENNFKASVYVAEWAKLNAALKAANALNVRTLWVLMAYTFAGGSAAQWYPGDGVVDVVGADGYDWCGCKTNGGYASTQTHKSFATLFAPVLKFGADHNKPVAACEFGTPADAHGSELERTVWVNAALKTLRDEPRFMAATYFQHGLPSFKCEWTLAGKSLDAYVAAFAEPYFGGTG